MSLSVAVVGAGIVGLSSAINIQLLISGVKVTIIADTFGRDTTSPLSPGIFLPIPSKIDTDRVQASEWLIDGWKHHFEMANSPMGQLSGQTFMSGYCLWSKVVRGEYIMSNLVSDYKPLTEKEITELNFHCRFGAKFTTVVINRTKYLCWLMKEFRIKGGNLIFDTVYSLQELYGKYDIVVNCTGKRCRELTEDPLVVPVKSYAVQVDHEWKKEFLMTDHDIMILPQRDSNIVDVGFYLEPDQYEVAIDEEKVELFLNKARAFVPHIVGAEVVAKWAERRPYRTPPRVEMEMITCLSGPILPVVHTVGLGAETVSLAWGAGSQAAHLVQDIARLIKPFARVWRPFLTLG
ncbi:D-aspartate oxidase-like [Physella acuta]|uniref:D-aspartate oxidase-like n=1 Tax=Physella acuta TaxID=109671 RepID=UPI0027DC3725|nr:D-aspartate oxidase-like [Physella acuta]XP_059143409.1 D-aspartate oxidase-like [Physella acuta]